MKNRSKIKVFYRIILLIITVIILNPIMQVSANITCRDGSQSSCIDCHSGCCSHHGGCASGGVAPAKIKKVKKSKNNKLKEVQIDGKDVSVSNNMQYTTTDNTVSIDAEAKSNKAQVNYDDTINLEHGNNEIPINVEAENGNEKTYYIIIKKINDNTDIGKITIDGVEIPLEQMTYETNNSNIALNVVPEDKYANVEYQKQATLNSGENKIPITLTAENGKKQEYELLVNYNDEELKPEDYIIGTIMLAGAGTGVAIGINSSRKKKQNNLKKEVQCTNCQKINSSNSQYCINCGNKLK